MQAGSSGLTDAELARSKRKMEEKTKLYNALKKGKNVGGGHILPPRNKRLGIGGATDDGEGRLVDFDRKWADEGSGSSSDDDASDDDDDDDDDDDNSDSDDDDDDDDDGDKERRGGPNKNEMVEYTDEFGRTRTAPKSVAEKHVRKIKREQQSRDRQGSPNPNLIYGPIIQTHAFTTAQFSSLPSEIPKPESLHKPGSEENHYDASAEIRTKGVGFYAFSQDSEARKKEMDDLEKLRQATEAERTRKEEGRKRKRGEVERRKEEVRRRRREMVGGKWLEGFMGELEKGGE